MPRSLFLFLFSLLVVIPTAYGERELPNIVIIYADDMGYGDVSAQNPGAKLSTPNIDSLAAEGIRFVDAHSSSGICTPSRYALLTGNYHWRRMHGIVESFGPSVFKPNELTMARMLKGRGYKTAALGKWHLGWDWDAVKKPAANVPKKGKRKVYGPDAFDWEKRVPGGPLDQGFDYYFGDGTINFPPYGWIENDRFVEAPTEDLDLKGMKTKEGNWEFRQGPMVKDWNPYEVLPTLANKAVDYINEQQKDQPFFLYFALPAPHAPIIPNDEFLGKTEAGAFGDFVFQTDWVAGRVLKALKEKGFEDNTLVIFTSDNGPEYYAYERILHTGHSSMGELRGLKRDTYEGGHRVPFIARWPGKIGSGRVSQEVINQVDIFATLAAITNYKLPNDSAVDSHNLLAVLSGERYQSPLREATIQNTFEEQYVVRKDKWALINSYSGHHTGTPDWYLKEHGYSKADKQTQGQLFDLSADPSQKNDLYSQNPAIVKEMQDILHRYRSTGRSVPVR